MDKKKLIDISNSYLGTPHHNGASVKGQGVDCSTLFSGIFTEMGLDIQVDTGYSGDWYMRDNEEEKLLPYLEKYCYQINESELDVGDIIAYKYGRHVAHLAMVYDEENVIHTHVQWGVEITPRDNTLFKYKNGKSRAVSFWRVKGV